MKKEFIGYSEALALKELGFDEKCFKGWYNQKDIEATVSNPVDFNNKNDSENFVSQPTFSQVLRWFREKYGYYYEIFVDDDKTFGFLISYFVEIGRGDKPIQRKYETYEEAELECLLKLISIVNNK